MPLAATDRTPRRRSRSRRDRVCERSYAWALGEPDVAAVQSDHDGRDACRERGQTRREPPVRVDDVGSHLVGDPAGRGRQRGDETRHEQRSARIARRRHEPAAGTRAARTARGHSARRTISTSPNRSRSGSDASWGATTVTRMPSAACAPRGRGGRGDGVVRMARERRGHVEDPVRHRPVPYGPVMSRADGAADGAVAGDTVGPSTRSTARSSVRSCPGGSSSPSFARWRSSPATGSRHSSSR